MGMLLNALPEAGVMTVPRALGKKMVESRLDITKREEYSQSSSGISQILCIIDEGEWQHNTFQIATV